MQVTYRIAVASTDGKVVNEHFGRANQFLIIEVDETGNYHPVELRKSDAVCHGNNHDDMAMKKRVEELSDCQYVLVSRIGTGAENALDSKGISVYVIPDLIESAVNKIISYIEINNTNPN